MTDTQPAPRLLLVDDDTSLLRLLSLRLESEGFKVTAVTDAESALVRLGAHNFAVVISDLRMPGLDGIRLFDQIAERYPGLPVILMTAHGSIPDAVSATQRGVMGFLTKPLDHDKLRELLDAALRQSHRPDEPDWRRDIITRSRLMEELLEQAGLFRAADNGTLFLDEIGDMPLPLQVKLLRVLQEHEVRPVGSSESIPVDVRVISATHRNLHDAIADGGFREDLYYRLNVVNLQLPGLRERAEDIPLLARTLLRRSSERHHARVTRFSDDAMQRLMTAEWPGNVRQLVNVIEQCVALCPSTVINAPLVRQALSEQRSYWPTLTEARDQFERQYLMRALKMTEGNVTRAAELVGRNRTDFYKLLKKHGLSANEVVKPGRGS